ncbi:nitrite reductase large subunit NirB [Bacillus haynesii]|uniref:nitrite reductase large subunit NirB n=1 Tax=Bacillus haynesii TaxID=1925021 RepID=UPI00227E6F04|nr:nitrite reductase large subunit NirB [Bacillus haynesii]MCY8140679.1 nitrite reductase large subunit NirB [Bacillus haynesii]MCY8378655.1 nitrite reductase large subunit NirB [Bacillus haynesii]MEC0676086.1 nitrite reductase large subunit NirB [Bacillus haynesii]MEC1454146.1 nitrite reductase large subunit NirB [Bacillus haynesii]MEC1575112.1 nitrite reductase large subunit NirB [Bacillus haynesii]
MGKQRLVLIGNGMAGVRMAEEILQHGGNRFEIVIIGSEPHLSYNRILLSSVLQGETDWNDVMTKSRSWYEENGITLYTGETAVAIHTVKQTVATDQNREIAYDKLIIATGSSPFILPVHGADKEGVYGFRTIDDCRAFIKASKRFEKAAVIGGGILGLEAARGLANLGMKVDVIHHSSCIMQNQLDPPASAMLQKELERQGIHFLLEKDTEAILGTSRAEGVRFKDGTKISADLIVMAAGVRPNIELAKASGISTNRAIIVSDYMETNVPNVYAVGECAEHNGTVYGLVKPLYEQGKVLAKHICGLECAGYQGSVQSATLKMSGIDVFSAGKITEDDSTTAIKLLDEAAGVYKKAVFQEDKMAGVILYGDTNGSQRLLESIIRQRDITVVKKELFQSEEDSSVASMALGETICQCNAVSKGAIMEAIQRHDLKTAEEVKHCTNASGSCGGCRPMVEELLLHTAEQDGHVSAAEQPMCACTSFTEDEVVNEIQIRNLSSVHEVISVLGWKNSSGCQICVPAIHYYLKMIRPDTIDEEHEEETDTLIPQMYGGRTNAEELKRIAGVIEKYQIQEVYMTHHQRLKLAGIKPEHIERVKEELGMPYCLPQQQRIAAVKTCPCGSPQIQTLAADLEKAAESLLIPAKVSIGVSGCLDDCVYASVHGIGLLKVNGGWEIYAGGQGGQHASPGELLSVADSAEEAGEFMKGLLQYYRETANYLENIGHWIERAGIIHIREVLFDNGLRGQLIERLEKEKRLAQQETIKGLM